MQTAKKIALATTVIVVFAVYSWQQRFGTRQVILPFNKTHNDTNTSAGSNSSAAISLNNNSSQSNSASGSSSSSAPASGQSPNKYNDGTYDGSVADAFYGNIQVEAVISGGKITDVKFLQYPNDRQNSIFINSQAMPMLKAEALKAQSAQVDIISGATDTSQAFIESLSNALAQT